MLLKRALLAFVALPGVVAFAVPLALAWLAGRVGSFNWLALIALVPGLALLLWCVREFYAVGKGTLAPWAPPRQLVSSGLYRFTRNPMYLAVALILMGWAIAFSSLALLIYAVVVLIAFHLRVRLHEEPYLARTHREEWKRYASRVPRWIFPSRKAAAVAWIALLAAIPIGGLIYEAIADGVAQREFPAPGTMVDIGGRRLHLLCIGEGQPIVFFEHAGFGSSLSSSQAREEMARRTTVCSYDRSGMGWSDPAGERAVSTGDLVRDLAVLQDRAKLPGPYILVASSIGGLTAELFARQFPERVAGLLFLDAANSLTLEQRRSVAGYVRSAACTAGVLGHFGVFRLLDPFGMGAASEGARRGTALTYNARVWDQLCAMSRGLTDTEQEFANAPPLRPDVPLTVLSASGTEGHVPGIGWFANLEELHSVAIASHQRFARHSSRGRWAVVPDSTHLIASSQPAAVVDAVFDMLEETR